MDKDRVTTQSVGEQAADRRDDDESAMESNAGHSEGTPPVEDATGVGSVTDATGGEDDDADEDDEVSAQRQLPAGRP